MFDLSEGSSWVFSLSGDLPQATNRLVGANLGGVFYVTGGNVPGTDSNQILSWDPEVGEWREEGEMMVARSRHAVAVVVFSDISTHCM